MFRNRRVAEAMQFAMIAHGDQKYGNMPYFTHFLAVAEEVDEPSTNELIAALLHDVVEDTPKTINDIEDNFGGPVADIVELLTKQDGEKYMNAINRIIASENISALKVKIADNTINRAGDKSKMSPERRSRLSPNMQKHLLH